jgi:hypothetical protein
MQSIIRTAKLLATLILAAGLSGCDDPQVYGSVGISSGYSSYGGHNSGPRMRGSISVGGRIH